MRLERLGTLQTADGKTVTLTTLPSADQTYGAQFVTVFPIALKTLCKPIRSIVTMHTLLALPEHLDWATFRRLDQNKLAAEVGTSQASISRSLAELVARGLLERQGKGPVVTWKLSIEWGWNSNVANYHRARATKAGKRAPPRANEDNGRRRDIMEIHSNTHVRRRPCGTSRSTEPPRRASGGPAHRRHRLRSEGIYTPTLACNWLRSRPSPAMQVSTSRIR